MRARHSQGGAEKPGTEPRAVTGFSRRLRAVPGQERSEQGDREEGEADSHDQPVEREQRYQPERCGKGARDAASS